MADGLSFVGAFFGSVPGFRGLFLFFYFGSRDFFDVDFARFIVDFLGDFGFFFDGVRGFIAVFGVLGVLVGVAAAVGFLGHLAGGDFLLACVVFVCFGATSVSGFAGTFG